MQKSKTKVAAFLLLSAFQLSLLIRCDGGESGELSVVRAEGGLRVRVAPELGAEVRVVLAEGTSVRVVADGFTAEINGLRSRWYKIRSDEVSGWVFGGYLEAPEEHWQSVVAAQQAQGALSALEERNQNFALELRPIGSRGSIGSAVYSVGSGFSECDFGAGGANCEVNDATPYNHGLKLSASFNECIGYGTPVPGGIQIDCDRTRTTRYSCMVDATRWRMMLRGRKIDWYADCYPQAIQKS